MRDQAFITTLDAAEEYMALQQALGDVLRAGFLSLAKARYSMGADRVSALQYPAHMAATARLRFTGDGQLALVMTDEVHAAQASHSPPPGSQRSAPRAGNAASKGGEPNACGMGGSCDSAATATPVEQENTSVEVQLERLRMAARDTDSILQQLAAKYGCADGSRPAHTSLRDEDLEDDAEFSEIARPGKPIQWFGSLVAPSLRDAEQHFGRALEVMVRVANAQRRLRQHTTSGVRGHA